MASCAMKGGEVNSVLLYSVFLLTETPQSSKFMKYSRKNIIKLFISDKTIKKQTKGASGRLVLRENSWSSH